jgi:putative transposase
MQKSRFTEAQIGKILAEHDAGASMEELGRRHSVHANTIRLWRSKYAGMKASDLTGLKQLEAENAQMQRIIARQTIKIDAIEELLRKKLLEPSRRAEAVKALMQLGLSQREACKSGRARRRSSREEPSSKCQGDAQVATRLTTIAQQHSEHGCRRLYNDMSAMPRPATTT